MRIRGPAPDGVAERMCAEIDEIRRAHPLQRDENRLGGEQKRTEAHARRGRPDHVPREDAEGRANARPASADERIANRERGVGTRCDDHDYGGRKEGDHSMDSARSVETSATRSSEPVSRTPSSSIT